MDTSVGNIITQKQREVEDMVKYVIDPTRTYEQNVDFYGQWAEQYDDVCIFICS